MGDEIELISDGDGVAVIGPQGAVDRFLAQEELPSRDLGLPRLSKMAGAAAAVSEVAVTAAGNSGRWVKLTEKSAQDFKKYGLMTTPEPGVSHAMIGNPGKVKSWMQIENSAGAIPTNPAVLAGAPALMAQLAMQQAMDEITDYLAVIDAKLDEVLRSQKDAVLAQMIGIGLQIEEAMTVRDHVGRVSEVTWSKVQATSGTIADVQAYALLQLDALAEKLERKNSVADLMKSAQEAETKTRDWLAVLARCFQLQDGITVLELDRVLETTPEDLEGHRLGLKAARQDRLATITQATNRLLTRIHAAAGTANSRVLYNPIQSPAVVNASAQVTGSVVAFHECLGITYDSEAIERRSWTSAMTDVRDRTKERGSEALTAGKRLGSGTGQRASAAGKRFGARLSESVDRRRRAGDDEDEKS